MKNLTYLLTIPTLYIIYLISDLIVDIAKIFIPIILIILILSGIAIFWFYIKSLNAALSAKKIQQAKNGLVSAPKDHQIFIPVVGEGIKFSALHLKPNQNPNGHYQEATSQELSIYKNWHTSRSAKKGEMKEMIIDQVETKPRSIFDLMSEGVHFSIIGPTHCGKTTLANHIIDHFKADTTYALDPDAKFNNWSNRCQIVDSFISIGETLAQLTEEMERRYEEGPSDHSMIVIVIDEYPAIKRFCPNAPDYLARLAMRGRKVNIKLILITQTDLINELGIDSQVRENFYRISMRQDLVKKNQATIRHWDKTTEVIELAGEYGVQGRWFNKKELVNQIVATNSKVSDTQLAKTLYGSDGGRQLELVRKYRD